jgi:RNA polymerase sigma-70 factor (ECF subfamily)
MATADDRQLLADGDSSDRALLDRIRTGEQDAARELYQRYAARLQRLVSAQTGTDLKVRFDPEDVVQSVFRTLFRRVSRGLYDVPAGDELWQLLLVLALNKTRKLATYHRAQRRDVGKTHGSDELRGAAAGSDGRDQADLQVLELLVEDLMADLPETHRQIIRLRIEGHRADDISRETKRSKRTVERVLQEFRNRLGVLIDAR